MGSEEEGWDRWEGGTGGWWIAVSAVTVVCSVLVGGDGAGVGAGAGVGGWRIDLFPFGMRRLAGTWIEHDVAVRIVRAG